MTLFEQLKPRLLWRGLFRDSPPGRPYGHLHDTQATVVLMVVIVRAAITRTKMLVGRRVCCWLRDMEAT